MANIVMQTALVAFFMWAVNLGINTVLCLMTEQMIKEIQKGKYGMIIKWIQEKFKEWKDRGKQEKITEEMVQKEDSNSTATIKKAASNWLEVMAKLASVLTVLISVYTFFMLWATEQYLEKYHIGYINAQLPSKSVMLCSIIAAAIAIGVVLVWDLSGIQNPHWIVQLGFYIIITFVFWGSFFVVKSLPLNEINFDNIKTLFRFRVGNFQLITIIAMMTGIYVFAIVLFKITLLITQIPKSVQIFGVLPVIVIGAVALFQIVDKDVRKSPTIHIQATEEMKVWTDNVPIADDGKQIWAIIYENSEYYFAEPIDISSSGDPIDTTHVVTLEKADVILYTETVEEVLSNYKKPCVLNNQ